MLRPCTPVSLSCSLVAGRSARPGVRLARRPRRRHAVYLRPVDANGHLQPGYQITKRHGHANCLASSEATGNAYRCFAGHIVYDPCWVEGTKTFVICLAAPWSYRVPSFT